MPTGPWVGAFSETVLRRPPSGSVRLIAGSHIVVPRLFDHDRAYIFQAPDGRVVFAMPFERDFTMIGTTDRGFSGDPAKVEAERGRDRLSLQGRNDHFRTPVFPADVIWSFAGVRPLMARTTTSRREAAGHAARLCAGARSRRRRGAAADGLWRQDHDLSPSRRGGLRQARAGVRRAAGLDQGRAAAGWRLSMSMASSG